MTLTEILPWIAAASIVLVTATLTLQSGKTRSKDAWLFPAFLCGLFVCWSLYAVTTEGPLAFWAEHVRNRWGNQIWFDLLLAAGIAWTLILPRARTLGMKAPLWLALILCTGSIGLLAMLARLLFLERAKSA